MSIQEPDMDKPVLLIVEDNPEDLERIERELRKRYGEDYRVVCESSTEGGMRRLRECEAAGEDVALVLADQWVPQMTGAEFLARTRNIYPTVIDGGGEGRLEHLVLKDSVSGSAETVPTAALFVLIGAEPNTEWLSKDIVRDRGGYIVTGQDLLRNGRLPEAWPLKRPPMLLETSVPGVFAAGDVRHGSVKRVASAVGEGSIAIPLIHNYLN